MQRACKYSEQAKMCSKFANGCKMKWAVLFPYPEAKKMQKHLARLKRAVVFVSIDKQAKMEKISSV